MKKQKINPIIKAISIYLIVTISVLALIILLRKNSNKVVSMDLIGGGFFISATFANLFCRDNIRPKSLSESLPWEKVSTYLIIIFYLIGTVLISL